MSRFIISLFLIFNIIFLYTLDLLCQNDTIMNDIYTPVGSPVISYLMVEMSFADRLYGNFYGDASYPDAIKIQTIGDGFSATRRFNCHGFAGLRVEEQIDRGIGYSYGNTDPDIYITDGSYIEVPVETYPGKVFGNRPGDHSAITTNQAGWFISKGNRWPLFKHKGYDSPFGTDFKFFIKNCSVGASSFSNVIVSNNKTVFGSNVLINSVSINPGSFLKIIDCNEVTLEADFKVQTGAELEINISP